MANANVTRKTTVEITGVTLHLSKEEAEAVSAVLAKIGGHPEDSPRKHTEAVAKALTAQGLSYHMSPFKDHLTGTLVFYERPRSEGYMTFDTYGGIKAF